MPARGPFGLRLEAGDEIYLNNGTFQCAIHEIFSVVRTRFPTLRQNLQELHKWQDIRDGAVKVFYKHKASHIRRTA